MEWTEERVIQIQQLINELNVESLDKIIYDEENQSDGPSRIDTIASEDLNDVMDNKFIAEVLQSAIRKLRPRELRIITLRFGLDGTHPHTLQEIGDEFGTCRERIRQIERKALAHLKHILSNSGINKREDI